MSRPAKVVPAKVVPAKVAPVRVRRAKVLPAMLLAAVLAVLAVPVGLNLAPAFTSPPTGTSRPSGAVASSGPAAAQARSLQPPSALSTLSGIGTLSADAPMPDPSVLSKRLEATLVAKGGGEFTALVQDGTSGQVLYSRNASAPRIPASNLKLLTAAAALKNLGADTRFSTRVLAGADANSLVLQAGGDVLLGRDASAGTQVMGHAGVATLAARTAEALKAAKVSGPVSLTIDDTLFSGPAVNPQWLPADVAAGEIAPVYPMALFGARVKPAVLSGPRPQDAAASVAAALVAQLKADGVAVAGAAHRAKAPAGARALAEVSSATVGEQVQYMLQASDNYLAEVLGRMTALAQGKAGSSLAASAAIKDTMSRLGLLTDGLVLGDSCGLAVNDRVSARQLTQSVKIMLTDPSQDVRQGLRGLPIAGLSGTLGDRYLDSSTAAGAGLVRAKTGTLNAVLSLSGYVVDRDGRLLVFSFLGNSLQAGSSKSKPAIDKAAAILAGCGCTG